jgi:hypothetical protein
LNGKIQLAKTRTLCTDLDTSEKRITDLESGSKENIKYEIQGERKE